MLDILEIEELRADHEKEIWDLFVKGLMSNLDYRLAVPVTVVLDDPKEEMATPGKLLYIQATIEKSMLFEARYFVSLNSVCNNSGFGDQLSMTFCKSLEKYILNCIFKDSARHNYDLEEFVDIHTGGWRV